jgi:acetolactate synthase small subunit
MPDAERKGNAMRDFAVHVTDRPGEIARVADALARKDVNIKSIAGMVFGHQGIMRVIADDIEAARSALREANIRFEETELVSVLLENKAGELGEVASKLSNAGLNVLAVYVIGLDGDLVDLAFAVDDPKKAKKVLE